MQGLDAEGGRGYLSNVCVAPLMRQRGIGVALLQQAQKLAQLWGMLDHLSLLSSCELRFLPDSVCLLLNLTKLFLGECFRNNQFVRPCRGHK